MISEPAPALFSAAPAPPVEDPALKELLKNHSELELLANGKILCTLTKHELPRDVKAIEAHFAGPKYLKAKKQSVPLPRYDESLEAKGIVVHLQDPRMLYSLVTNDVIKPSALDRYLAGRKYKAAFPKWLEKKNHPEVKAEEDVDPAVEAIEQLEKMEEDEFEQSAGQDLMDEDEEEEEDEEAPAEMKEDVMATAAVESKSSASAAPQKAKKEKKPKKAPAAAAPAAAESQAKKPQQQEKKKKASSKPAAPKPSKPSKPAKQSKKKAAPAAAPASD